MRLTVAGRGVRLGSHLRNKRHLPGAHTLSVTEAVVVLGIALNPQCKNALEKPELPHMLAVYLPDQGQNT